MNIPYLVRDLVDCNFNLQAWINKRYWDPAVSFVHKDSVEYLVTKDGLKFLPICTNEIEAVPKEIQYDDITSDDVVLDLGANVGGFAIRAAQKAKHVYAVEPLFIKTLRKNIQLNGMMEKITVIPSAIGDGSDIKIQYGNKPPTQVPTVTLPTLLKMIEPITFLKIDIEGAEWGLYPEQLRGIRRIEFEAHEDGCMPVNRYVTDYIRQHWQTTETKLVKRTMIHARAP